MNRNEQFPEANLSEEWLKQVEDEAPHLRRMVANYRAAKSPAHRQQIANTLVPNAIGTPGGKLALGYYTKERKA